MQTYNLMKSGLNAAQLRSKTIANNIANIKFVNSVYSKTGFIVIMQNIKIAKTISIFSHIIDFESNICSLFSLVFILLFILSTVL